MSNPYIMTIRVMGVLIHTPECEHGLPTFVCPKCGPSQDELENAPIIGDNDPTEKQD
jgi:hypothetical protein